MSSIGLKYNVIRQACGYRMEEHRESKRVTLRHILPCRQTRRSVCRTRMKYQQSRPDTPAMSWSLALSGPCI